MSNIVVNTKTDTSSFNDLTQIFNTSEGEGSIVDFNGFTNNDPVDGFTNVNDESNEKIEEAYEFRFISTIPDFEYSLKKSFCIFITNKPDSVSIQSDEFKIYVTEEDYNEALEVFFDLFVDDFYNWFEANDNELTEDALELKHKYLEYVRIQ